MKVEMITPQGTQLIGDFPGVEASAQVEFTVPGVTEEVGEHPLTNTPDPAAIVAAFPSVENFEEWFYSEEVGVIVAHTEGGPYILISLPPGGPREDGLYWDGPYTMDQVGDMVRSPA